MAALVATVVFWSVLAYLVGLALYGLYLLFADREEESWRH
jgi:hypothetical protein